METETIKQLVKHSQTVEDLEIVALLLNKVRELKAERNESVFESAQQKIFSNLICPPVAIKEVEVPDQDEEPVTAGSKKYLLRVRLLEGKPLNKYFYATSLELAKEVALKAATKYIFASGKSILSIALVMPSEGSGIKKKARSPLYKYSWRKKQWL